MRNEPVLTAEIEAAIDLIARCGANPVEFTFAVRPKDESEDEHEPGLYEVTIRRRGVSRTYEGGGGLSWPREFARDLDTWDGTGPA